MEQPQYNELSDEELAAAAVTDHRAFAEIIRRYQGKLFTYTMRISNVSKEEAEDILQDAFLKAYRNLNDFDTSLKLSSWLYRITHNQVISEYRKRSVRAHGHTVDIDDTVLERLASDVDTAREIDLKLLRQNIEDIMSEIDEKYREVLVLRFFEEQSYQEISDILRKPIGTVATLVNRAKSQFHKAAQARGIQF